MSGLAEKLSFLTIKELEREARRVIHLPSRVVKRKTDLINFIESSENDTLLTSLDELASGKEREQVERTLNRKRKIVDNQRQRRVSRRVEIENEVTDVDRYLELPTEEDVTRCYREFFEASGNEAVKTVVCGVCAREVNVKEKNVTIRAIKDIPHSHRLIPVKKHTAHELFDGLLLEPSGVDGNHVKICADCFKDLERDIETPPKFSLANNLWIGRVPWELDRLTLPEQLLIAHLYPRVYVFKLYPKFYFRQSDRLTLQRGMRGNVSTYKLNTDDMTSMIKGNLMPRPPSILASIISVTFIGLGAIPDRGIHTIFRVRRYVVLQALQWLKKNNPKYYGAIEIDMDQINNLPEDDVPSEITSAIRQSYDLDVVEQENGGYVRDDNDANGKMKILSYNKPNRLFINCTRVMNAQTQTIQLTWTTQRAGKVTSYQLKSSY
jgi:hypothetical protein